MWPPARTSNELFPGSLGHMSHSVLNSHVMLNCVQITFTCVRHNGSLSQISNANIPVGPFWSVEETTSMSKDMQPATGTVKAPALAYTESSNTTGLEALTYTRTHNCRPVLQDWTRSFRLFGLITHDLVNFVGLMERKLEEPMIKSSIYLQALEVIFDTVNYGTSCCLLVAARRASKS
jgi:hypothetical protein